MQKARLIQFSAVVVGNSLNPTILNPDFVGNAGIVPRAWEWEVAETITTPMLSSIKYSNGVTILVEQSKVQITDKKSANGPASSKIGEIACSYVKTLPHVRYTAVGNNFQSAVPKGHPGAYLKQRFVKEGPWCQDLDSAGVQLVYPITNGRLMLSINGGEVAFSDASGPQSVVIVNANFSRKCTSHPSSDEVVQFLSISAGDWSDYSTFLPEFFEDDDD